jgi:F-type H+-transporting ATPase subunit epsilon
VTLRAEVVSPERILYSGDARMVLCRTTDGEIAFLTDHAPLVGALGIGEVRIDPAEAGAASVRVAVHGGFVEVRDNRVIILSDVAELAEQIDVDRARRAKASAEEALRADPDDEEAADALKRAEARLKVAEASPASV